MKICAITTWPPYRDGISLYSFELYNHISRLSDVIIIANMTMYNLNEYQSNVNVLRCWKRGFIYPFRIFISIIRNNPDIIHIQHGWLLYGDKISSILFPFLLLLLRLYHRPIIVTMHTIICRKNFKLKNSFITFFSRIAIFLISKIIVKFSDAIIVHNRMMKNVLLNEYNLIDKSNKIVVIPHGIKRVSKNFSTIIRSDKPRRILSLGFLRKEKNIEVLVEAFKRFLEYSPNAKLIIVGGKHAHDNENCFDEQVKYYRKNFLNEISFTGFVDEKILDEILLTCDMIVLLSSERFYIEASGTLARVANYGKPIICSRVPKFECELKNGHNCIMVNPGSEEDLVKAFILLNFDQRTRERIGLNLKNSFKNRYWSCVAYAHFNLYKTVIRKFNK